MCFVFLKAHLGGKAESGGREESGKRIWESIIPELRWNGMGWGGEVPCRT